MRFIEALDQIRSFWPESSLPFAGAGPDRLRALERDHGRLFPEQLRYYIQTLIPADTFPFTTVGNPLELHGYSSLSTHLIGYNYNPVTRQPIHDWNRDWFLIADEGADPFIVDLASSGTTPRIFRALHGQGQWRFEPIADSLPQFLLLAAARHHALERIPCDGLFLDDALGFRLAEAPARWLFPRMRIWAGEYYGLWLESFHNR